MNIFYNKIRPILIIGLIICLFNICMIPVFSNASYITINRDKDKKIINIDDETDYYAVIAACSEYKERRNNIPKWPLPPISEEKLTAFYHSLLDAPNWREENIILLLNEQASKNGIINALTEMSTRVGSNDVFLFSWQGHGSEVPDNDGDEEDGTDEIIVPYDIDDDNYITDDDLDYYFSQIDCKAQVLIFESCLSGGLIGDDGDLDKDGRIVIVSTLEDTIGRATFLVGFPVTVGLAVAFNQKYNFHANDENNDGFISIQEGFNWGKNVIFAELSMYWLGIWVFSLLRYGKDAAKAVFLELLLSELFAYLFSGHFMLNWPHMIDKYNQDLPLTKLLSADKSHEKPVPLIPVEIEERYDEIDWEEIDIEYWPDLVAYAEVASQDEEKVMFNGEFFIGPPDYTFHWDFGDGTTSNELNPTHMYNKNGKYSVTFTITDGAGRNDSYVINDIIVNCKNKEKTDWVNILLERISLLRIVLSKM